MSNYRSAMALESMAQENYGRHRRTRDRAPLRGVKHNDDGSLAVHLQDVDGTHITRVTPSELSRRKKSDSLVREDELQRVLDYLVERGHLRADALCIEHLKKGAHRDA